MKKVPSRIRSYSCIFKIGIYLNYILYYGRHGNTKYKGGLCFSGMMFLTCFMKICLVGMMMMIT
jgi:hypothetical protein